MWIIRLYILPKNKIKLVYFSFLEFFTWLTQFLTQTKTNNEAVCKRSERKISQETLRWKSIDFFTLTTWCYMHLPYVIKNLTLYLTWVFFAYSLKTKIINSLTLLIIDNFDILMPRKINRNESLLLTDIFTFKVKVTTKLSRMNVNQ